MKQIAIIGIGLIGGSIAKSLKTHFGENIRITGYDGNPAQLQLAASLGVIDQQASSVETCIADADVIFLCIPVQSMCQLLKKVMLARELKDGAIITDVGSTKEQIVALSREYSRDSRGVFIGGHPMAGSHKSGVEAASDRLFENAYYVLTPSPDVEEGKLVELKELLQATKAQIVEMDPAEHDQIVGAISHVPHLLASSLVNQVYAYHQTNEWYLRLAAGGFRDITRIASSNPRMWKEITLSNKNYIMKQLKDWQERMQQLLEMVERSNPEEIEAFFAQAKQVRDGMIEKKQGAIPAFYDLYVDIPDHPGVIGKVTTLLGEHRISITNLTILETREDIMGVLRLTFRHKEDLEAAKKILEQTEYKVYCRD